MEYMHNGIPLKAKNKVESILFVSCFLSSCSALTEDAGVFVFLRINKRIMPATAPDRTKFTNKYCVDIILLLSFNFFLRSIISYANYSYAFLQSSLMLICCKQRSILCHYRYCFYHSTQTLL